MVVLNNTGDNSESMEIEIDNSIKNFQQNNAPKIRYLLSKDQS